MFVSEISPFHSIFSLWGYAKSGAIGGAATKPYFFFLLIDVKAKGNSEDKKYIFLQSSKQAPCISAALSTLS